MPVTVTEHLKLDVKKFNKTGAFDSFLDIDSRLFIDPALIWKCKAPEFLVTPAYYAV